MDDLIQDIDEAINTGKFTHESLNWIRSFRRRAEKTKEVLGIYKEALKAIAGLDGPLTGEDATCFRTWAEEALEAYNQEIQPVEGQAAADGLNAWVCPDCSKEYSAYQGHSLCIVCGNSHG